MTQFRWWLGVGLVLGLSGCPLFELDEDMGGDLSWQDPPQIDGMTSGDAEQYCESLELGGNSDWRLPTIDELRTLIEGCGATASGGSCPVGEECLDSSCDPSGGGGPECSCRDMPAPAGQCFHESGFIERCHCYASSSVVGGGGGSASSADAHWKLCFEMGEIGIAPAALPLSVRCVRGSLGSGNGNDGSGNGSGSGLPTGPGGPGSGSGDPPPSSFPAAQHSYTGTPATRFVMASSATHGSTPPSYAMTSWISGAQRGSYGGSAIADTGSCGDGSAFICSGLCCGAEVTTTPSTCCPTACCTDTPYCDFATGGCGYTCEASELDCGDGTCCPTGTQCRGNGQCESDVSACAAGTLDCGDGSCCPSGTTCNAGSCDYPAMCEGGTNDCGDGTCCPSGSSCAGGGECEQPGCDVGVQCGDFCCEPGDQCLGSGQCAPQGCPGGEIDCGGGFCCPFGTTCSGSQCMEQPEPEPEPDGEPGTEPEPPPGQPQPPIGGTPDGSCDTADLLAALGGMSAGNACVDGCIQSALRCAGAAGCVLTAECQDAEVGCVMGCFQQ